MWRRLVVIFAVLTIGGGALSTVAYGDTTTTEGTATTTTTDNSSTSTIAASTIATSTTTTTTSTTATTTTTTTTTTVPIWPATVGVPINTATRESSIQLTPTFPEPTTTTTRPALSTDVPANSGNGRRIIYGRGAQRVWLINADNSVLTTYRVSGRLNQPDPGTFAVWSRSTLACAIHNNTTCMRWMVRFARGPEGDNIGFHEIPTNGAGYPLQSNSQLGIPLSHGCVRQSTADAQTMWAFGQIGTTVVVVR